MQNYTSGMLSTIAGLNDKFDASDKDRIAAMLAYNSEINWLYSNATAQVTVRLISTSISSKAEMHQTICQ